MNKDASMMTKEQLIANLYRTDELINEIDIVKNEIIKKEQSVLSYIETEQQKFIEEGYETYKNSDDVKTFEQYEAWIEKVSQIKGIVILVDLIISVLLGDLLFLMGLPFLLVGLFWLMAPFVFYFIYKALIKRLIIKKQPKMPLTEHQLKEQLISTLEYNEIQNSMVVHYTKQEQIALQQKIDSLIIQTEEKSVLKELYWPRTRKLIWFLENQMADNLKEAIAASLNEENQEQVKQMIAQQDLEIGQLKSKIDSLAVENQRLSGLLTSQQEELLLLKSKK